MKYILAIDDDRHILQLLKKQLEQTDYQVITALSGKEGIDRVTTSNPDLVLLDIMMPEMDGFDVLKKLHRDEISRNIPVIMLSSKSKKEDVATAMKMGVVDYIVKPYRADILLKKIDVALNYSKARKEQAKEERTQHIAITRTIGKTIVSFRSKLSDKATREEIRIVFNSTFLLMTKKDICIVDFRSLDEIDEKDVPILEQIITIFQNRKLYVIAGRHYGFIVGHTDIEENENLQLFISLGDVELALLSEKIM
jgi:DNA-binding response OmpR family regulator